MAAAHSYKGVNMDRQQAINYLSNSGFSMIQVETIVKALSALSEVDFQELKDRYGDEVEYVVRDMISGENLRWVELPRPKKQEPKTGRWIEVTNGRGGHECDVCHDYAPSFQSGNEYLSPFCPTCGAKMAESEEQDV